MDKKEKSEKVLQIIKEHKSSSNKDLILAMDYLQEDFEFTKKLVLKGTEQLDRLELTYNTILKEYQKRMKDAEQNYQSTYHAINSGQHSQCHQQG